MTKANYDKNNIFAKIIRKEAKAEIVFENKHILCFKDIFPNQEMLLKENNYGYLTKIVRAIFMYAANYRITLE